MQRIGSWQMPVSALVAAVVCSAAWPSQAYYLPDSDQRKCYFVRSPYPEIPCAGTGQDGAYIVNPLSFTDNGDGTVTDNNTGLMWRRGEDRPGIYYNWYRASGTYHATCNPESTDVCRALALGGHTDWRLPTIAELQSITDHAMKYPRPMVSPRYFPDAKGGLYWSATKSAEIPSRAWMVSFDFGASDATDMNWDYGSVRCVRGAQAGQAALEDNGDGTVTDAATGLVWQQSGPPAMPWSDAVSYCENLSLGGSSRWRLPNVKELQSLVDFTRFWPSIDTTMFPTVILDDYWSSTSMAADPMMARIVGFGFGWTGQYVKEDMDLYVRCVRGGNDTLADALDASSNWRTGGGATWFGQDAVKHDGVDAARSGEVKHGRESRLQATVVGPKTITFWWRTSSEGGDKLSFSIDGTLLAARSGINGWQQESLQIGSGSHIVKWTFARDASGSAGLNAGFVDQVQFKTPGP